MKPVLTTLGGFELQRAIAAAFGIALVLWRLRDRLTAVGLFGVLAVLFGVERLLVEFVRLNDEVVVGLTAAQRWSVALIALGSVLVARERYTRQRAPRRAVPEGTTA